MERNDDKSGRECFWWPEILEEKQDRKIAETFCHQNLPRNSPAAIFLNSLGPKKNHPKSALQNLGLKIGDIAEIVSPHRPPLAMKTVLLKTLGVETTLSFEP